MAALAQELARKENAFIISKDEDFVDRWLLSETPVALIWIRKGNWMLGVSRRIQAAARQRLRRDKATG